MDDIIDSVDSSNQRKELTVDIDKLLQPGGFEIKHWTIHSESESSRSILESDSSLSTGTSESSCNDIKGDKQNNFHQIGIKDPKQKVLGVGWNPKTDSFHFSVRINFPPRRKKIRTGPDLNINQIPSEIPIALTKRMVLPQVNGIYDPLGFATPFTAKAKILLRKLCGTNMKNLDWDEPIPDEFRKEWIDFFRQLFQMERCIKRCIKPEEAIEDLILVLFSDGSENIFETCAYAGWQTESGVFVSSLIASKSRLAPLKKITIVRIELNWMVLSKQLEDFITSEGRLQFVKTYHIVHC